MRSRHKTGGLPGQCSRLMVMGLWQLLNLCSVGAERPADPPAHPEPISLAQAQALAFQRNWDLLSTKADVDIATAQKIAAKEFPNPSLNLGVSKISVNGAHPNLGSGFWGRDYDSIAAINQLFEIGGKRRSRQRSAEAGFEAAEARLADARRTLELGVAKGYVGALQADATAQALRKSAASLRREAGIADVRLKAGDISASDRDQIELTARRMELDAENAALNARTARIGLELLLGESRAGGNTRLSDSLEALARTQVPEPLPAPSAGRADLRTAQAVVRKSEADLKLQKAMRIPDPTVSAQYEHEPPSQPDTLGFGLSFPLPLWNRNRGNISAAAAQLEQARLEAARLEAQIAGELASSKLSYDEARKRWEGYQSMLQKSERVRESVGYAYEKGGASLVDLLTAERSDNDVRIAAAQAAADAATSAAQLRAAAQTMPGASQTR